MNLALDLNTNHSHRHEDHAHREDLRAAHHEKNCAECHQHQHNETENPAMISLLKEIHLQQGHKCTDQSCPIPHEHGHIATFSFKPLSEIILKSKLPHSLKEFAINLSFLSPAVIVANIAKAAHLPDWLSSWLAIGSMHGINRGFNKLSRLGLTMATSLGANIAKSSGLNQNLVRFVATSLIALIEKFSNGLHSHHHHHDHKHEHNHKKEDLAVTTTKELKKLFKNLGDSRYWRELLPSVMNVEAKVQILSPLSNFLAGKISNSKSKFVRVPLQILLTSMSFVLSDQVLRQFAKIFGEDSAIGAAVSGICGCCGSTVCAAAATDTAMSQSTFDN